VERVVDMPRSWESELIDNGGEDFGDGEGTFAFWGEFRVSNGAF